MNAPFALLTRCYLTRTTADKGEIKDFPKFACRLLFARRYIPLQKYASYLYTLIYLKVRRKKMSEKFQLKRYIRTKFGYPKVIRNRLRR